MSRLVKLITAMIPEPARRRLQSVHREYVFRRAMRKFLRYPREAITDRRTLSNLIYGWGNEDWSAMEEYLSGCLAHAAMSGGDILECGSGLTTVLIGALAQRSGRAVWTLEHDLAWAARVEGCLRRYRIRSVRICLTPLANFGEYSWYNPPLDSMPRSFSLVICDGPPGDTHGGRYGLLPVMRGRLRSGAVILLDDAAREVEKAVAARWETEFGAGYIVRGAGKPYFEFRVPDIGERR